MFLKCRLIWPMSLCSSFMEERLKEHFSGCLLFLPQQGDVVVPKLYETGFLARRYEGLFTAWVQQPRLVHHVTLSQPFTAVELSKCLCSCWCNCLSLNPHTNRVSHPKSEFTLTQLCRCDHPVYCLYKCLIIYSTSVHQPWCLSCSRRMHIQGFCWALQSDVAEGGLVPVLFQSNVYGSVPYSLMILSQYFHYYLILKCRMDKKNSI